MHSDYTANSLYHLLFYYGNTMLELKRRTLEIIDHRYSNIEYEKNHSNNRIFIYSIHNY